MISNDTYETALNWYETGVHRIQSHSVNLGITYLDRAIAVFVEMDDLRMSTYARHNKLLGLRLSSRFEEVENMFSTVMLGYTRLDDSHGQALLLTHLAESLADQNRWENASGFYHLASVVAENDRHSDVLTYIYLKQALMARERDNLSEATRLFLKAERLAEGVGDTFDLARYRYMRGDTLARLGETSEAVALLEDAQARFTRGGDHQEALKPLTLLRKIYDDSQMSEDFNRVVQLLHLNGQQMIRQESIPRVKEDIGPPIGQVLAGN